MRKILGRIVLCIGILFSVLAVIEVVLSDYLSGYPGYEALEPGLNFDVLFNSIYGLFSIFCGILILKGSRRLVIAWEAANWLIALYVSIAIVLTASFSVGYISPLLVWAMIAVGSTIFRYKTVSVVPEHNN